MAPSGPPLELPQQFILLLLLCFIAVGKEQMWAVKSFALANETNCVLFSKSKSHPKRQPLLDIKSMSLFGLVVHKCYRPFCRDQMLLLSRILIRGCGFVHSYHNRPLPIKAPVWKYRAICCMDAATHPHLYGFLEMLQV